MITLRELSLCFGETVVFDKVSATIGPHDRIGLVGNNGSGKTTLLRVVTGEEKVDAGHIERAQQIALGYLPQDGLKVQSRTLYSEVESALGSVAVLSHRIETAGARLSLLDSSSVEYTETLELIGNWEHQLEGLDGYKVRPRVESVLLGLGFSLNDLNRDTGEFSGGWQMRIALAKLLLQEPSLLLLDEPTNHLDLPSQRWFENYLHNYSGALLLVSHDRAFLDALTDRTFALSRGKLERYKGNYTFYEEESNHRRQQARRAYQNQRRKRAKTQKFIDRFRYNAARSRLVQSRLKAMEKIEWLETDEEEVEIAFSFPSAPRGGRRVLGLEGISKSYGDLEVFSLLDLEIERGNRVAVVGANGAGKSTLARIMGGVEPFDAGERTVGFEIKLGWFAQNQADELDPELDVLATVGVSQQSGRHDPARDLLGAFLFRGDDVFKRVSVLSGGEKSRLALARMLLQPVNFLIFDEPTNHLDMTSKRILQEALVNFEGSFVIVSHDRNFLDPLVNRVIEVKYGGTIRSFPGNVSEYIAKVEGEEKVRARTTKQRSGDATSPVIADKKPPSTTLASIKQNRRQEAEIRQKLAPLKKRAAELEARVAGCEEGIATIEKAMTDPAFFTRGEATNKDLKAYESIKRRLDRAYAEWEKIERQLAREAQSREP